MSRALRVNKLIESIKTRAMLPETENTFTEARFLAFANEEMDMAVLPVIMGYHESYFLDSVDIPLEAGVTEYKIPERAIGNKLRDVSHIDLGGHISEMTQITVEDVATYQYNQTGITGYLDAFYVEDDHLVLVPEISGTGEGYLRMHYYRRPNTLVPEDQVAFISTAPDFDRGLLTVSSLPTTLITAINEGQSLDINKTKSPHVVIDQSLDPAEVDTVALTVKFGTANIDTLKFVDKASMVDQEYWIFADNSTGIKTLFWYNVSGTAIAPTVTGTYTFVEIDISGDTTAADVTATTLSQIALSEVTVTQNTDTLTFTNTELVGDNFAITLSSASTQTRTRVQTGAKILDESISKGDYIAIEGECIIPQIPQEAHSLLAQRVAARCLEAIGDMEGLQTANAKIGEMEQKLSAILDTRVEGAPHKIFGRHGFFRR